MFRVGFVVLCMLWTSYAHARFVFHHTQGPRQPQAGDITGFDRVHEGLLDRFPWARVDRCTVTTLNGLSTESDPGGNFAIFNVPVMRGALEARVICEGQDLTDVNVRPTSVSLTSRNQRIQLRVVGTLEKGDKQDLTLASDGTTYTSSDPKVATIDKDGKVLAVGTGTTTITVTHGNFTKKSTINVKLPPPLQLTVEPALVMFLGAGTSQTVSARLLYLDGSNQDVTRQATFKVQDPTIAQAKGSTLTALKEGTTTLLVESQGRTGYASLVVKGKLRLTGLGVQPPFLRLTTLGEIASLQVTGSYSDGSKRNLTLSTSGTVYKSSAPQVATVTSNGVVEAVSNGTATITVTHPALPGTQATIAVTVKIPKLVSLVLSPASVFLSQPQDTTQLVLTGTYGDNSTRDLTQNRLTKYVSSAPNLVAVSSAGLLTAVAFGKATITATYDGKSAQVNVEVRQRTLSSIAFAKTAHTLVRNNVDIKAITTQLALTATYNDSSTGDVTLASQQTTYKSSNPQIANVDANGRVFSGANTGTVTITATHQQKTATTQVTIQPYRPRFVKALSHTEVWEDLWLTERYAYVTARTRGLRVVDLKDTANPKIVASLPTQDSAVAVYRAYPDLWVSDRAGGVHLYSLEVPEKPERMHTIQLSSGEAHQVVSRRGRLFVAAGEAGILIYDISTPWNPKRLGQASGFAAVSVAIDDQWLVAVGDGQVRYFDHTKATWWTLGASQTLTVKGALKVKASGSATPGTFYVAAGTQGLVRTDEKGTFATVTTTSSLNAQDIAMDLGWLLAGGLYSRQTAALFVLSNPLNAQYRSGSGASGNASRAELGVDARRGWVVTVGSRAMILGQYRQWVDYDKQAPAISFVAPLDNSNHPENQDLQFVFNATDDREIDKVEVSLDGKLIATLKRPPYTLSWPSPNVTVPTKVILTATAYDFAGNTTKASPITVNINPVQDSQNPTVQLVTPLNGSEVEKGFKLALAATASDNSRVAAVRFYVDNKLVHTDPRPPYHYSYTIPSTVTANTTLQVIAEAIDYGGNTVRSQASTVTVVQLTVVNADISETDTTYDNKRIAIRGKTIQIRGKHTFKSIWVDQGGTLSHPTATTTQSYSLELSSDYVYVAAGASIDVTGKGYLGANRGGNGSIGRTRGNITTGGASSTPIIVSGGGHGGNGGRRANNTTLTPGPASYGNLFQPIYPGGGSSGSPGGNGGGVIRITTKQLRLEGSIRANGAAANTNATAPGGAGGSIWIQTDAISGPGMIEANGGGRSGQSAAGGAGGRIALYYKNSLNFSLEGQVSAGGMASRINYSRGCCDHYSHHSGGAGTIYLKAQAQQYGTLVVGADGLKTQRQQIPLPQVGKSTLTGVTPSTLTNTLAKWEPGALVGLFVNPNLKQSKLYRITANTATTLTLNVGSDNLTAVAKAGDTYQGVLQLDALVVRNAASVGTEDQLRIGIGGGDGLRVTTTSVLFARHLTTAPATDLILDDSLLFLGQPLALRSLTLRNNASIQGFRSTTTEFWPITLKLTNDLNIDETSSINANAIGYLGANRHGNGSTGRTAGNSTTEGAKRYVGGAHGGPGGYYTFNVGPTQPYDSMFEPKEPGGGAGHRVTQYNYAHGGGVINITAANIKLDGSITANGGLDSIYGGAGGSVVIRTGTLRGKGTVEANGGGKNGSSQAPGGGGRIAIYYSNMSQFPMAQLSASGAGVKASTSSTRYVTSGPGTIFLKGTSQKYGTLLVTHSNPTTSRNATTRLPQVGKNQITAITSNTLSNANATWQINQLVGHFVNPNIAQQKTYKILSNTATTLTLDVGTDNLSQIAKIGDTYQGVLYLDDLFLRGKAQITTDDQVILDGPGQALVFQGGSIHFPSLQMNKNFTLELNNATMILNKPLEVQSLTLKNGARLTTANPTSRTQYYPLQLKVATTLSIDATSSLDATGKGYFHGVSPNTRGTYQGGSSTGGAYRGTGGSHGGLGGRFTQVNRGSTPSPTYGRFSDPKEPGAGGGCYGRSGCAAGHGGGLIALEADSLKLDGTIAANGQDGTGLERGAGAGGGINIRVRALEGTGRIEANGGSSRGRNSSTDTAGAGGGGRIALRYTTLQTFDPTQQMAAAPGRKFLYSGEPGAGTIYFQASTDKFGTLLVDQNNVKVSNFVTQLLSIGEGEITALTSTTLTSSAAKFPSDNQLFGLFLNPDVAQTQLFTLQSHTPTILTVASGDLSKASSVGKTYRGVLQLDRLIVRNGARVLTADDIKATKVEVSNDSALMSNNLQLPACPSTCTADSDCKVFGCGAKTTCSSGSCQ